MMVWFLQGMNMRISSLRQETTGMSAKNAKLFRDSRYPKTVWKNKRVAFFFDNSTSEKAKSAFRKAAQAWRDNTCIDIYEDTCGLSLDRIRVLGGERCWSHLGRKGGEQNLSIGTGCETIYSSAHELGHALGFFHTHARHDRNKFVRILTQNIKEGWQKDFHMATTATNFNYHVPFDVGSIMLYTSTTGSANNKPTVLPVDPLHRNTLGSPFISFYDFLLLNRHYNCTEKCKPKSSAQCAVGGFPHPRNCSKCICPGGYGGPLCKHRPSGCGSVLTATPVASTFKDILGNKSLGRTLREDFSKCHYWIKAPKGKKVEIKLLHFSAGMESDGCRIGGVEIKTQADQRLTGYRFCSKDNLNTTLVSPHSVVPIITYNRAYYTKTVIQYRHL